MDIILKNEDVSSILDDELVYKVMSWMWSKFNSDWSDQFIIISSLPKACQDIYSTYTIEAEVNNGGFNQCYFNSSKEFTLMAEDGFLAIGAEGFSDIMKRANKKYTDFKAYFAKYDDRTLKSFSMSYENNPLHDLDDEFYKMYKKEPLDKLCIDYIRQNAKYFEDLRECEMIVIENVKLEFEDYKNYNYNSKRNFIVAALLFCFLLFVVVSLIMMLSDGELNWHLALSVYKLSMPIGVVLGVILTIVCHLLFMQNLKKQFKGNLVNKYTQQYTFSDNGIEVNSKIGNSILDWEDITAVVEKESFFGIYISLNNAFVIPKRFIQNKLYIMSIRETFKSNLPADKLKLMSK